MPGTSFEIRTRDNGTVTAQYATNDPSDLNNATHGETVTFEFEVFGGLLVESGVTETITTYREVEQSNVTGGTVNVSGGTLNVTGTSDAFRTLQQFDIHAGSYSILETLNNEQRYRLQIPSSAEVGTLLVKITPTQDLQEKSIYGVYGLVDNVSDARNQPLTTNRLRMELTVLARGDEYSTLTDAETALEI